eukprot:6209332-Pleurochrysis_carterae.AAC.5
MQHSASRAMAGAACARFSSALRTPTIRGATKCIPGGMHSPPAFRAGSLELRRGLAALALPDINQQVVKAEYAVRGAIILRAAEVCITLLRHLAMYFIAFYAFRYLEQGAHVLFSACAATFCADM